MEIKYKEGQEQSCVLVAETNEAHVRFNVAPANIEKGIKVIKAAYEYLGNPCNKVYISGFTLVSKNTNLTKEGIINRIAFQHNLHNGKQNAVNAVKF